MAPIDPHSYTDGDQPLTTSVDLEMKLDFAAKQISGVARLKLNSKAAGTLNLDTRDLTIENIVDGSGENVAYELASVPDPIKGKLLKIFLEGDELSITYHTSAGATALQWLAPEQTAGGRQAYVFTQCQPIHARSVFPCQDTPQARIKYTARVEVPRDTRVVMSAAHVGREEAGQRATESFAMEQPIPPYLFALAAGDIVFEDLSPRCRVYAEPSVVQAAAHEFADTEKMIQTAETLFGPYDWDRFDILVMPPSFPYGGMENPRMTFLTPTVIAGDRSLVGVVAHELAHSWTGNLITNATANDFWLNEGWTVYAERRIQEALEGYDRLQLYATIGWTALEEAVEEFKEHPGFTRLKGDLEGTDPDEVYSSVPYEKGYLFVKRLEEELGRDKFDKFIRKYIARFRFQSITTETFIEFLTGEHPEVVQTVDIASWVHGTGIPSDAPRAESDTLTKVKTLASQYMGGYALQESDYAEWKATEWQIYLEGLPKVMPSDKIEDLDRRFSFSSSKNSEIQSNFLTIAANSAYKPCYPAIEESLLTIGRMKYLKPLYQGLIAAGASGFALEIFEKAKPKYHVIAAQVISGLFKKASIVK